jgi:NADH-quinone oxidoreductase subunit E
MKTCTQTVLSKFEGEGYDNLIPILQEIQESAGWLSEEDLTMVGHALGMPVSKVYGVATFYNQFRFQPLGKFHIEVCRGTACHVLGSSTVLEEIRKALKINVNETSRDGLFSLEIVSCIGTCGLAPVIKVNGEFYAGVTSESLRQILASLKDQANTQPE